jgi:Ser/Thr protein kinase RdoA (MazF antagonist)
MPTSLAASLPSYRAELDAARRLLADGSALRSLGANDRKVLAVALAAADEADAGFDTHVLHGSPHRLNVLTVDGEPRFIDFETVCLGPWEWDMAHLEQEVALHYPEGLDPNRLKLCRTLVSAKTAVWCWEQAAQSAEMRWHAEHHLDVVKEAVR